MFDMSPDSTKNEMVQKLLREHALVQEFDAEVDHDLIVLLRKLRETK